MTYYRNPYRPKRQSWKTEKNIGISNFGGGMNNVESDNVIADNECSNSKNMMFISSVLMQKRGGVTEYDTSILTPLSEPITWVDEYKPLLSDRQFIRCTATKLYVGNTKICDVANSIRGVNYMGKYYFVDGEKLRVYDGTNVYQIVTEPTGYLSKDSEAGSNKKYLYVYLEDLPTQLAVNDTVFILSSVIGAESDLTGTVNAIDTSTKKVTLLFSSEQSITIKKGNPIFFYTPLALDKVEGETKTDETKKLTWYEPCLQQLKDTYTGAGYIPKQPKTIAIHKDRLFISGDDSQPHGIYMSWVSNPLWFPSNSYLSVKPNGEEIVDLVVFDNALIIGRHNDMFVLYGSSIYPTNNDAFYIKQMDVSTGFMCAGCGALLNNFYIFLGYDGRFYKLNTPTTFVEYLMTRPLPRKIDLYSEPFNLSANTQLNISVVPYYNEIYFNVADDIILVYNYDNMAWTWYTGFNSKSLYNDGKTLYCGTTGGKLVEYKYDSKVYNDLGYVIKAEYATKRFDFGSPINYKYFKSLMLTTHAFDEIDAEIKSEISVDIEVDYYNNSEPIEFNSNLARFGKSDWGKDRFNNRNLVKTGWFNLDIKGRTIKFIIKNEKLNQPIKIYDLNLLCTMRDVR